MTTNGFNREANFRVTIIMFTSGASHRGRIDTDLYIETPDFYTHLRKRTILWLAHLLAYVELYEQYDP